MDVETFSLCCENENAIKLMVESVKLRGSHAPLRKVICLRMTTAGHVVESKRLDVCAPHPSALFSRETTDLLSSIATVPVIAIGPPKERDFARGNRGRDGREASVPGCRALDYLGDVGWKFSRAALCAHAIQPLSRVSFWRVRDPIFELR